MKLAYRIGIPIVILAIGAGLMFLFLGMKETTPRRELSPRSRNVVAETVSLGPVVADITAYGRVTSVQPVRLISEVAGRLEAGQRPFRPAQSFSQGDLLVKVDDRQARYRLNSAKSELLNALAKVLPEIKTEFPSEYQAWQDYFDNCRFDRPTSELPELGDDRIRLFLARYNVYKLYYAVLDQEVVLEKHFFRAPFDGSIISTSLALGSTARAGSVLAEIVNRTDLELEASVSTNDLPWIDQHGQAILTSTETGGTWSGGIKRLGSALDARTQTAQVFVDLADASPSLLEGIFLQAHLPGKVVPDAIRVPREALYDDSFVYIIQNGQLTYRQVVVARQETEAVIVTGGLVTGDTLVLQAMQGVAPGMPAAARMRPRSGEQEL